VKRIFAPIIVAITFSLSFSSASFAGWTKVSESVNQVTFHLDFSRMRKNGGYVYFWLLQSNPKPNENGTRSLKIYAQADCNVFRFKYLSFFVHTEPMGVGDGHEATIEQKWLYPVPDSSYEIVLKEVCSR
jgi:hypothetical protein